MTEAGVCGVLKLMMSPDILLSSGFVRPLSVAASVANLLDSRCLGDTCNGRNGGMRRECLPRRLVSRFLIAYTL